MLGNLIPSTGISVFVHMCHVVDTLWCLGALSDLPGQNLGRISLGGRVLNLSDGVVTNLEEISVHYVTSRQ